MIFTVSGLDVSPLTPVCAGFIISLICSGAGISGAFLLLPWQTAFLGYSAPGVSGTNQIFNLLACPGGVIRYAREGRLLLPLVYILSAGTLPGVFIGGWIRVNWLQTPRPFGIFAGLVLLWIGSRLFQKKSGGSKKGQLPGKIIILNSLSFKGFSFQFENQVFSVPFLQLSLLAFLVGIVGGAYGVGGGAIISPFLVSIFDLPIHAIAGATLFATFITALASVAAFTFFSASNPAASPDWALGILLGLGGLAGMYLGAAVQKYLPAALIRLGLGLVIVGLGATWLVTSL